MVESAVRSQLEELERDRLSVYVSHARVPWWYWPFLGLSTGLLLASNDLPSPFLPVLAVAVYAGLITYVLRQVVSDSGVMVLRFRGMPGVLRRPLLLYTALVVLVVVGGMLLTLFMNVPWSFIHVGVAAGLVTWLGGWLAFRVFSSRAERLASQKGVRR